MIAVSRFSIAPVKSLAMLHPESIDLTERGVAEDRRFYLIDATGRLIDGLLVGSLVQVGTWTNADGSVLRITMPDGAVIEDTVHTGDAIVNQLYGRTVHGHVVDGPWAAALSTFTSRELRLVRADAGGGTRDGHQASLMTDGSLGRLAHELGNGPVDGRRMRLLIELEGGGAHEEDTWIGRRIELGGSVLLISGPVPRCAMTTHDPDTGARDLDTLRAIRAYRGLRNGKDLDFGVYGEIERAGTIQLGDEVRLL